MSVFGKFKLIAGGLDDGLEEIPVALLVVIDEDITVYSEMLRAAAHVDVKCPLGKGLVANALRIQLVSGAGSNMLTA